MNISYFAQAMLMLEWICVSIYSHTSIKMLKHVTFVSPNKASFIILMISYIARPIGAYFFAKRDKYQSLYISCILLMSSCFLFAIAPTSFVFIWALICRTIQSFAIGVGYGPSYILIHQKAARDKNIYVNHAISIAQSGLLIGLICGDFISLMPQFLQPYVTNAALKAILTSWRLPFAFTAVVTTIIFTLILKNKDEFVQASLHAADTNSDNTDTKRTDTYSNAAESSILTHMPAFVKFLQCILICGAISIEMGIFYFSYIYMAAQFSANDAFKAFWTIHKFAFLLLMPVTATLTDIINKKFPKIRNYWCMCLSAILLAIFGALYPTWPNIFLAIISLMMFLTCYSTFISWTIERFHASESYQIGILFHVAAVLFGGPLPFLATILGAKILIVIAGLSLTSLSVLFILERKFNKKQVSFS